jgi:hypothetical protein
MAKKKPIEPERKPVINLGQLGVRLDPNPLLQPDGSWRRLYNGDFAGVSERTPAGRSAGAIRKRGSLAPLRATPLGSGPILSIGSVPLSSPFGGVVPPVGAGGLILQHSPSGSPDTYSMPGTATYTNWSTLAALTGQLGAIAGGDGLLFICNETAGLQQWNGSALTTLVNAATLFPTQGAGDVASVPWICYDSGVVYVASIYDNDTIWVYRVTVATSAWAQIDEIGAGWTSPEVTGMAVGASTLYVAVRGEVPFGAFVYAGAIAGTTLALDFTANVNVAKPTIGGLAVYNGEVWAGSGASDRAARVDASTAGGSSWSNRQIFGLSGASIEGLFVAAGSLFMLHQRATDECAVFSSTGGTFTEVYDLLVQDLETIEAAGVHGDVLIICGQSVAGLQSYFFWRSTAGVYTRIDAAGGITPPDAVAQIAAMGEA